MSFTRKLAALAAAALLATGMGAQAAILNVVGGSNFTLPGTGTSTAVNSFNPVNFSTPGSAATQAYVALDPDAVMRQKSSVTVINGAAKNATNGLSVSGKVFITFTYMLKEAGYTNVLLDTGDGGSVTVFQTGSNTIGQSYTSSFVMGPGLLNFRLQTISGGSGFLDNDGTATSNALGIAYSALFNNGRSIIVGFDDAGAGPDRDYDDLVFRIDITPVPLPAAGLLLLAGLGGLGLMSRRRAV
jgi:hypothetical protein